MWRAGEVKKGDRGGAEIREWQQVKTRLVDSSRKSQEGKALQPKGESTMHDSYYNNASTWIHKWINHYLSHQSN